MTIETVVRPSEFTVHQVKPVMIEPAMYQVIMHNDDFTPMEFVVTVLEVYFNMDRSTATRVMYEVHTKGKAVCGVFTKDVAETKVEQVMDYASMHEHPLLCSMEGV